MNKRTMKRYIIIGALLVSAIFAKAGPAFDAGFKAGFVTGYRQNHGQLTIAPICPIPPIAPVGEDDYSNGFKYGLFEGMSR
jgi:hypothetical protein